MQIVPPKLGRGTMPDTPDGTDIDAELFDADNCVPGLLDGELAQPHLTERRI